MEPLLNITDSLAIDRREIYFTASRGSGPGGQNVNKVNTRITLWFDVAHSPSLSAHQKALVQERLSTRINKNGLLRVCSRKHRTQAANRNAALERLAGLLQTTLQETEPRKPTQPPKKTKERRLQDKKHRSRLKVKRTKID